MQSEVNQLESELAAAGAKTLMTIKEAAAHARCSYTTVWRAVQRRALPSVKRGRNVLIRRSELARWIGGS